MNENNLFTRWSLSGTHLMVVISGEFKQGTYTAPALAFENSAYVEIPTFIKDRIYLIYGSDSYLDGKDIQIANFNAGFTTTNRFCLRKWGSELVIQFPAENITFTSNAYFRVQFDLLIDTD